ncbi:MAG: hypothetical protein OSA95_10645 [Opitutales bacterium]|nr:hypothetical protein [Opitutales bacterium]
MPPEQTIQLGSPSTRTQPTGVSNIQKIPAIRYIRMGIWLYFILLMLEGALRKWIFPEMSQPLLIIRDPIVIGMYFLAYNSGIFPTNSRIRFLFGLGMISLPLAIIGGGFSALPTLYGIRSNCLHFPLIFLIPRVFSYIDVIKIGRIVLWLALPMTFVVINQFQATPEDNWNVAAGGTGTQLETSGGKVRASGTFSFVSGIVYYYALLIAFLIIGFLRSGTYAKLILWIAAACAILALATSGSRAVVAGALHVLACFGFLAAFNPRAFGSALGLIISLTVVVIVISKTPIYVEGVSFLKMRFDEASNVEGDAVSAYFQRSRHIILSPLRDTINSNFDLFGRGIGAGTQAGVALGAPKGFFGENEWQRHILESGIIVGNLFIFWRVSLALFILRLCIRAIKMENYLPIFLWGSCSHIILWMPIGQPTTLGFAALGGGLCLTAIRSRPMAKSNI